MDYKYINQLLERYWRCETSLEEEDILRAFFSQEDIPAELLQYKALFSYEESEPRTDVLGDDFDEKILRQVEGPQKVKARVITMPQRLKPLFKAAAVVAIILTLGNAMQVPYQRQGANAISQFDGYERPEIQKGTSVAMSDSAVADTMGQSMVTQQSENDAPIIK